MSDTLKISGKGILIGTFDPDADDVTLTVSDVDGDLYTVTLPAGSMVAKNATTYSYKDKEGTIGALKQMLVKLGKTPDKDSKLKVKTIKTDFSSVVVAPARDITTHLINGTSDNYIDIRVWEPNGLLILQATK